MNHSQFLEQSGLNSGTLSRILQGSKPISFRQLGAITAGMGLAEDFFFDAYVAECFAFSVSMRRIRPFIYHCAALGRVDCIEQIVRRLLDDLSYSAALFDIAEELFASSQQQAAALIYVHVSEAEKYQHSERLAVCKYRLFRIGLSEDMEENVRAANLFELYVNRLNEADQLDALKQLMHVFGMVHKWAKVDELAKEMHRVATIQYDLQCLSEHTDEGQRRTERPLYYYILYAYLARSTASEECGDYKRALDFVALYSNGESWVQETGEEARRIIGQFSEWAIANTYLYRLMSGDVEVLDEYANYIASQEDEIFVAVRHMVQAANRYGCNIDSILERFSAYIPYQADQTEYGEYKPEILKEGYAQFLSDLAVYHLNQNEDYAMKYILEGLELSITMNSSKIIITCMTLFEQYRDRADLDAKKKFKKLSNEVNRLNAEKSVVLLGSL
ncbi:transcriptional regulator [Paenibacillus donghaensis]|uniref:Transcriptional regulator n=2 Tax=Paenibacillus donghaensis TaxID=414771 RepID=A0A2Z2KJJ8_9BACL|nr:transcriptional regulator [Paenibacillus donghaensis]